MQTVEVTWKRAMSVWWLWFWRTLAFSFLSMVPLMALLFFFQDKLNPLVPLSMMVLFIPLGFYVSYRIFRYIFTKKFKTFRAIVVPFTQASSSKEPLTFWRMQSIFWCFIWRCWLMTMAFMPVVMIMAMIVMVSTVDFNKVNAGGSIPEPDMSTFVIQGIVLQIANVCASIFASIIAIQMMFKKRFQGFQLFMVPRDFEDADYPKFDSTLRDKARALENRGPVGIEGERVFKVFWAWFWRTMITGVSASFINLNYKLLTMKDPTDFFKSNVVVEQTLWWFLVISGSLIWLWYAMKKHHRTFKVVLLSRQNTFLSLTKARILKLWIPMLVPLALGGLTEFMIRSIEVQDKMKPLIHGAGGFACIVVIFAIGFLTMRLMFGRRFGDFVLLMGAFEPYDDGKATTKHEGNAVQPATAEEGNNLIADKLNIEK